MNQVIKFSAEWCGPCRAMKPQFEKFQESVKDTGVEVIDADVDKEHELAEKYGVRSIPYTVFVKDGKIEESFRGVQTADVLTKTFNEVFSN